MLTDLFLGYAIGDAFGAGVEFQDRRWIRANVDFSHLVNVRHTIQAAVPDLLMDSHYTVLCGPQPIVSPRFPEGIHGLPSDAMLTGGTVLYILKHFRAAYHGFQFAIRLGGDVDTIAAIVTGILGARYGLHSLPAYMMRAVEGIDMLKLLADDFEYWCKKNP